MGAARVCYLGSYKKRPGNDGEKPRRCIGRVKLPVIPRRPSWWSSLDGVPMISRGILPELQSREDEHAFVACTVTVNSHGVFRRLSSTM